MLCFSKNEIHEKLCENEKELLSVKLSFPVFEGDDALCKKLNDFYSGSALRYFDFFKTKHYESLKKQIKDGTFTKKNGAVINWQISHLDEKILSVINDISFFDGSVVKSVRHVQNWDLGWCTPLCARKVFSTSPVARKKYLKEICEKINKNEGAFSFKQDAETLCQRYFDFEKFYFVPKGIAFYFDKNRISSGREYPSFVIPRENIYGLSDKFTKT